MEETTLRVELLLHGLAEHRKNNASKLKDLAKFRKFMEKHLPDMFDDDVELLLLGRDGTAGILAWCGSPSENHAGQLKRHCGPAIELLDWLITYRPKTGAENLIRERFHALPLEAYGQMRLPLHVIPMLDRKRSGSSDTACRIVVNLLLAHHNWEDNSLDPLGLEELLPHPEDQRILGQWCFDNGVHPPPELEDEFMPDAPGLPPGAMPGGVHTPGGLTDPIHTDASPSPQPSVALSLPTAADGARVLGGEMPTETKSPGASGDLGDSYDANGARVGFADASGKRPGANAGTPGAKPTGAVASMVDSDRLWAEMTKELEHLLSDDEEVVVKPPADLDDIFISDGRDPHDPLRALDEEAFDPALFLRDTHRYSDLADLKRFMNSLDDRLGSQQKDLQTLVRKHFPAFMRCADGIDAFARSLEEAAPSSTAAAKHQRASSIPADKLEDGAYLGRLLMVEDLVEGAARDARRTFAPLLHRLRDIRSFRLAKGTLAHLSTYLDVPGQMREALGKQKYALVIDYARRITMLPTGDGLEVLAKAKEDAVSVGLELIRHLKGILVDGDAGFEELVNAQELVMKMTGTLDSQRRREITAQDRQPELLCTYAQLSHARADLAKSALVFVRLVQAVAAAAHEARLAHDTDAGDAKALAALDRRRSLSRRGMPRPPTVSRPSLAALFGAAPATTSTSRPVSPALTMDSHSHLSFMDPSGHRRGESLRSLRGNGASTSRTHAIRSQALAWGRKAVARLTDSLAKAQEDHKAKVDGAKRSTPNPLLQRKQGGVAEKAASSDAARGDAGAAPPPLTFLTLNDFDPETMDALGRGATMAVEAVLQGADEDEALAYAVQELRSAFLSSVADISLDWGTHLIALVERSFPVERDLVESDRAPVRASPGVRESARKGMFKKAFGGAGGAAPEQGPPSLVAQAPLTRASASAALAMVSEFMSDVVICAEFAVGGLAMLRSRKPDDDDEAPNSPGADLADRDPFEMLWKDSNPSRDGPHRRLRRLNNAVPQSLVGGAVQIPWWELPNCQAPVPAPLRLARDANDVDDLLSLDAIPRRHRPHLAHLAGQSRIRAAPLLLEALSKASDAAFPAVDGGDDLSRCLVGLADLWRGYRELYVQAENAEKDLDDLDMQSSVNGSGIWGGSGGGRGRGSSGSWGEDQDAPMEEEDDEDGDEDGDLEAVDVVGFRQADLLMFKEPMAELEVVIIKQLRKAVEDAFLGIVDHVDQLNLRTFEEESDASATMALHQDEEDDEDEEALGVGFGLGFTAGFGFVYNDDEDQGVKRMLKEVQDEASALIQRACEHAASRTRTLRPLGRQSQGGALASTSAPKMVPGLGAAIQTLAAPRQLTTQLFSAIRWVISTAPEMKWVEFEVLIGVHNVLEALVRRLRHLAEVDPRSHTRSGAGHGELLVRCLAIIHYVRATVLPQVEAVFAEYFHGINMDPAKSYEPFRDLENETLKRYVAMEAKAVMAITASAWMKPKTSRVANKARALLKKGLQAAPTDESAFTRRRETATPDDLPTPPYLVQVASEIIRARSNVRVWLASAKGPAPNDDTVHELRDGYHDEELDDLNYSTDGDSTPGRRRRASGDYPGFDGDDSLSGFGSQASAMRRGPGGLKRRSVGSVEAEDPSFIDIICSGVCMSTLAAANMGLRHRLRVATEQEGPPTLEQLRRLPEGDLCMYTCEILILRRLLQRYTDTGDAATAWQGERPAFHLDSFRDLEEQLVGAVGAAAQDDRLGPAAIRAQFEPIYENMVHRMRLYIACLEQKE